MPELVGEGVGADDRLVRLDDETGDRRDQPRGAHDGLGPDAGVERHVIVARAQRHDDLLHRRVAGALAQAVDGALDLAGAGGDRGERIGHRQSQVVVAVHGEDRLVDVRDPLAQHGDQAGELVGHGIADRVRDVDGAGAGGDRRFDAAAQEVAVAARSVLARPFDVVGEAARVRNALDDALVDLVRLQLQLVLHVQRTGGDEGVDAPARGGRDRFRHLLDVGANGARQAADGRGLDLLGDGVYGVEVAARGDREPGLDHVDAHLLEHLGDAELFLQVHRGARRLLAVAQSGIEDDDPVGIGNGSHRVDPSGIRCHKPVNVRARLP